MGQVITFEQIMASEFEWIPGGIDTTDENSPPPMVPDENGFFPAPVPGEWVEV